MRAVRDADHVHASYVTVDANQDAIVAPTSTAVAGQIVGERFAEAQRILGQYGGDEFHDCGRDLVRKPAKIPLRRRCDGDSVRLTHRGGSPKPARRSAAETVSPVSTFASASATASRMPGCESQ